MNVIKSAASSIECHRANSKGCMPPACGFILVNGTENQKLTIHEPGCAGDGGTVEKQSENVPQVFLFDSTFQLGYVISTGDIPTRRKAPT